MPDENRDALFDILIAPIEKSERAVVALDLPDRSVWQVPWITDTMVCETLLPITPMQRAVAARLAYAYHTLPATHPTRPRIWARARHEFVQHHVAYCHELRSFSANVWRARRIIAKAPAALSLLARSLQDAVAQIDTRLRRQSEWYESTQNRVDAVVVESQLPALVHLIYTLAWWQKPGVQSVPGYGLGKGVPQRCRRRFFASKLRDIANMPNGPAFMWLLRQLLYISLTGGHWPDSKPLLPFERLLDCFGAIYGIENLVPHLPKMDLLLCQAFHDFIVTSIARMPMLRALLRATYENWDLFETNTRRRADALYAHWRALLAQSACNVRLELCAGLRPKMQQLLAQYTTPTYSIIKWPHDELHETLNTGTQFSEQRQSGADAQLLSDAERDAISCAVYGLPPHYYLDVNLLCDIDLRLTNADVTLLQRIHACLDPTRDRLMLAPGKTRIKGGARQLRLRKMLKDVSPRMQALLRHLVLAWTQRRALPDFEQLPARARLQQQRALRARHGVTSFEPFPVAEYFVKYCTSCHSIRTRIIESMQDVLSYGVRRTSLDVRTGESFCCNHTSKGQQTGMARYLDERPEPAYASLDAPEPEPLRDRPTALSSGDTNYKTECMSTPLIRIPALGYLILTPKGPLALCCRCGGPCYVDPSRLGRDPECWIECGQCDDIIEACDQIYGGTDAHVAIPSVRDIKTTQVQQVPWPRFEDYFVSLRPDLWRPRRSDDMSRIVEWRAARHCDLCGAQPPCAPTWIIDDVLRPRDWSLERIERYYLCERHVNLRATHPQLLSVLLMRVSNTSYTTHGDLRRALRQ